MPLSPRQQRALSFIKGYISSNNQAPTLQEIANHVGYDSVSGTHKALRDLERRGLIKRSRDRAWRDLQVLDPSACEQKLKCSRCGLSLPISEFGICRSRKNGRTCWCRACNNGHSERHRKNLKAIELARKPYVLSEAGALTPTVNAFCMVYEAIASGCRTIKEIQRHTKLSYDLIGEALVDLVWNCKVVRIVNREFLLVEDQSVRAA